MLSTEAYIQSKHQIEDELLHLFSRDEAVIIFDIGTCEGEDAVRYSNMFPSARIFAFEPRPDNLKKIHENLRHYQKKNVIVSDLALSSSNGTATFFLSSGKPGNEVESDNWDFGNKSSSLLPPSEQMKEVTSWLNFDQTIEVNTKRLDDYCAEHKLERIDLIHMDVQGAELMVLEGAGFFLDKVKCVWLEVEAVELYKDQPLKNDVENFMKAKGFQLIRSTVGHISGDQFYVRTTAFQSPIIESLKKLIARKERIKKIKKIYYAFRNKLSGK
jgi:2-O-methyltransferase